MDGALGMQFLHNQNPPKIHRDLKSANLLVTQYFVVKIGDFGTARQIGSFANAKSAVTGNRKSASSVRSTHLDSLTEENMTSKGLAFACYLNLAGVTYKLEAQSKRGNG